MVGGQSLILNDLATQHGLALILCISQLFKISWSGWYIPLTAEDQGRTHALVEIAAHDQSG